jgi:hypothetical protein
MTGLSISWLLTPHIAKRLRNRVIKAGAILSDTGLRNRLEDPLRVAGKVDDFVHLSMELQVEDFVSRAKRSGQLGQGLFGLIEFAGRIHAAAEIQQDSQADRFVLLGEEGDLLKNTPQTT